MRRSRLAKISVSSSIATTGGRPASVGSPGGTISTVAGTGTAGYNGDGIAATSARLYQPNGSALDRTKWVPQTNFVNGSPTRYACYVDDPAVVSVSGGSLRLSVKDAGVPVTCPAGLSSTYAAGQVSTFYKFSQRYGRFEARMKVPAATQPGLQEAFWLWPDVRYHDTSTWPLSGEIDIVETYSQHPTLAIPFLHYSADSGGPQPGLNTAWNCAA